MSTTAVPEVIGAIAELGLAVGVRDICKLPGCWEHQIDENYWFAMNGHKETTKCSQEVEIPPFSVYITFNGWPFALVDPRGGCCGRGEGANEDKLIKAIRAAIGRLNQ